MDKSLGKTICWTPTWKKAHEGIGLEHLLLTETNADSVVLGIDEERGPFRLVYRLSWDTGWQLHSAELSLVTERSFDSIALRTDGKGRWEDGAGRRLAELDGCRDIDIWPTPFTNSFPIRRRLLAIGERQEFRMAWVDGLDLTVRPQPQRYTRLSESMYLFESLDGSSFQAELPVDEDSIVLDYPGLFQRVKVV
ncbi:putative glycolipid-binding domain-containing protein [Noviherbaspirillum sp. CPCC 100848]|uniref:Glycolipid-binding domain-containing protein n=1 Tax=Noviherbaspirillum album TaxID=3080276 RepID=A0ABU6J333_9BURK|nr:putative glycolipid-binding domain-containing protein [Noviherbaspirillum sp. CPCC 100848]MEC4717629.1 putative glycolipid-binding domain-containing protein [Noviherbaspirillum sp. CPCC 100848]